MDNPYLFLKRFVDRTMSNQNQISFLDNIKLYKILLKLFMVKYTCSSADFYTNAASFLAICRQGNVTVNNQFVAMLDCLLRI